MQSSHLFRSTLTATGLWLMLSPFLLFSQAPLSQNAVALETGTLMTFGLLALVIASYSYKRQYVLQAGLGIAFGTALLLSPWYFGFFDNAVATWNTGLVGLVIIVTALAEPLRHQSGRGSW